MKRKEQILEAAIRLFNQKGYTNVSLREIAAEAGTTIGNLTYHFPQKEELILSITENLQTAFIVEVPKDKRRAELLSHLLNSFLMAERNEQENPFYYKNIYELTLGSETLARRNKEFGKKLYDYYLQIFRMLREDGVLRSTIEDRDLESMAYVIVLAASTWLQGNAPYRNELMPDFGLAEVLTAMIRTNISEEYQKELRKLTEEKGIGAGEQPLTPHKEPLSKRTS